MWLYFLKTNYLISRWLAFLLATFLRTRVAEVKENDYICLELITT